MNDHLWQHTTSVCNLLPGQLSLLSLAGQEMIAGQDSVMVCSWGAKAG